MDHNFAVSSSYVDSLMKSKEVYARWGHGQFYKVRSKTAWAVVGFNVLVDYLNCRPCGKVSNCSLNYIYFFIFLVNVY